MNVQNVLSRSPSTEFSTDEWKVESEEESPKIKKLEDVIKSYNEKLESIGRRAGSSASKIEELTKLAQDSIELNGKLANSGKTLEDLQSKIREAKKAHRTVCQLARKVVDLTVHSLSGEKNSSEISACEELKKYLTEHPDGNVSVQRTITQSQAASKAYVHAEVSQLEQLLTELLKDTSKLVTQAIKSKEEVNIELFRLSLAQKKSQFENVIETFKKLQAPVNNKLEHWEDLVESYRKKSIPADHYESIAIVDRISTKEVAQEIEKRESINAQRIQKHDELANIWCLAMISKAAIEWNLSFAEIFSTIYVNVDALYKSLSTLDGEIEQTKEFLKLNIGNYQRNPEELKKILESKKIELERFYSDYKKYAETGKSLQKSADEQINFLAELEKQGGTDLVKHLTDIHFFDTNTKNKILELSNQTITSMQDNRKILNHLLAPKWHKVYKRLDVADNKKSLTYELTRLCYAIEVNKGSIPYDAGYKSIVNVLYRWTPDKEPVSSPWVLPTYIEEKKS